MKNYYASVRYVDSCLDDFFTKVEGDKSLDSTLFIVTSDHGKYLQNIAVLAFEYAAQFYYTVEIRDYVRLAKNDIDF